MIKLILKMLSITALLHGVALSAHASTVNSITCNNCTESEAYGEAYVWGLQRLNFGPAGKTYKLHVADFTQKVTRSFNVTAVLSGSSPLPSVRVAVKSTSTPSDIKQNFDRLYNEMTSLRTYARSIVIPEEVISDAWEYVGCAYCNKRLEDYIDTMDTLQTGYRTVEQLATSVGIISSALPNTFTLQLKSGGDITFEMNLDGDFKLRIKIVEVRDESGNEVPDSPTKLTQIRIYVEKPEQRVEINNWLREFGFQLGGGPATGVITIEEV